MIIQLKKFGTTLVSRQNGKEAFAGFQNTLRKLDNQETIGVDFEGVHTLTPSWADEFLTPLKDQYGKRLLLHKTKNLSVNATMELLGELSGKPFTVRED